MSKIIFWGIFLIFFSAQAENFDFKPIGWFRNVEKTVSISIWSADNNNNANKIAKLLKGYFEKNGFQKDDEELSNNHFVIIIGNSKIKQMKDNFFITGKDISVIKYPAGGFVTLNLPKKLDKLSKKIIFERINRFIKTNSY